MDVTDPTPGEIFARAESEAARGRHEAAIALFQRVAALAPEDSAALTRAGHLLMRRDRAREAAAVLARAVARHADNATAWFLKGEASEKLADDAAAIAAYREVVRLRPDLGIAHAKIGALLRAGGVVAAAIPALRAAARLEAGEGRRHADLAHALHDARMTEQAVPSFRRQVLLEPSDPSGLYNLAVTEPLLGARESGLALLSRTVVVEPANGAAWTRIGRLRRRLGIARDTLATDRRALVLEPADHEPLLRVAAVQTGEAGRSRATTLRMRAVTLVPDDPRNRVALADLLIEAGMPRDAMAVLHPLIASRDPAEAVLQSYRRACEAADEAIPAWCRSVYRRWIDRYDIPENGAGLGPGDEGPEISVIMPVCDPPADVLDEAIRSVMDQGYPRWQLCIADDASRDPAVRRVLERHALDPRVDVAFRARRGHISAASNTALERAAGEVVCFLDHDDRLAPHALGIIADTFRGDPDVGLAYSDEDKIDAAGARFDPHFKPDWNPDLLLSQNYVCHLLSIRRELVEAVGGFRTGLEGSQDHDLVLRVSAGLRADQIVHIPRVLYHWRAAPGSTALGAGAKPYAVEATRRVLQDHHDRERDGAVVQVTPHGWRTHRVVPEPRPLVSIIIPTRDRCALLRRCVDGLRDGTRYAPQEIIVVDNGSREAETIVYLDELRSLNPARVITVPGPFNFSRLNNLGAAEADGEILCFLNNDVEPLSPDWLEDMVSHALRPDTGVVGAKLLYPDRRVQHGGIILCGEHVARHIHHGLDADAHGYWGRAVSVQSLAAVTGACMVMRRAVFDRIDGFDEVFAVDFGDIDLCLRAGAAGYATLWTPHAVLLHHESASRGTYFTREKAERYETERSLMVERWGAALHHDPHYNDNLSIAAGDEPFDLAFPPRRAREP